MPPLNIDAHFNSPKMWIKKLLLEGQGSGKCGGLRFRRHGRGMNFILFLKCIMVGTSTPDANLKNKNVLYTCNVIEAY